MADRVVRAGAYELEELTRPDRHYCESRLFRDLMLEDGAVGVAECRANLTARMHHCRTDVCPPCRSQCTKPWARVAADVVRCVLPTEQAAFYYCLEVTDAGQLASALHGAVRGEEVKPVPEKLFEHAYRICHNNPEGLVQRDSVSCRKEQRDSPVGKFVPGFDPKSGNPVARDGYIVTCNRTSDCYQRCPSHPLTGDRYQCQKTYKLYDVARTGTQQGPGGVGNGQIEFVDLDKGSGSGFDPDPATQAITNEMGICVDFDSSMMQGCKEKTASFFVDGIAGCLNDRLMLKYLCGLELDVKDGDPSTTWLSGDLVWPRTLVAGGADPDGDGRAAAEVTCSDPTSCVQACRRLGKESTHGAGTPATCATVMPPPHLHTLLRLLTPLPSFLVVQCDFYCPSNIVSVVHDLAFAIYSDITTILTLIMTCIGGSGITGCICQIGMFLEPKWRQMSTNPAVLCRDGDPFQLLVSRIEALVIEGAEDLVNFLIDGVNTFLDNLPWPLDGVGRPINEVCFPHQVDPDRCAGGQLTAAEAAHLARCENPEYGLEELCYYARVKHICANDDLLEEYDSLFRAGYQTVDSVEADYAAAMGESFDYVDPVMAELMRQVEVSSRSGPDLTERRGICSSNAFASAMSLDMVR